MTFENKQGSAFGHSTAYLCSLQQCQDYAAMHASSCYLVNVNPQVLCNDELHD